jgi:RNA polymerase sigma-70 factor, ECF subfamily
MRGAMDDPATARSRLLNGLLERLRRGDATAGDELFALLYDELRAIARRQIARLDAGVTLQPTELVHEAWLKLGGDIDAGVRGYANRLHFCCTAAKAMRSVLVDHARSRAADKRGGGKRALSLDQTGAIATADQPAAGAIDVLPLSEALERLLAQDPELGEIVELRFFAGLRNEEIAALRGISLATVERRFAVARAWLHRDLKGVDADPAS